MRRTSLLLVPCAVLLRVLWPAPAFAQPLASAGVCDQQALNTSLASEPQRLSLGDARVSLVPPPGVRGLSPAEAERIVPFEVVDLAFGSPEGTVVSTRAVPDANPLVIDMLYDRAEARGRVLGRFEWINRGERVEVGGHRWVLFEYIHRGPGRSDRYARHYWTDFQGSLLVVRFSSHPHRRSEVARSAQSLQVHDCAWASPPAAQASPPAGTARTCSKERLRVAETGRVSIAGGGLSLVPPAGMRVIDEDPSEPTVGFVSDQGAVIMVALGTEPPIVDSPAFQQMVGRRFEAGFQNVEWIAREVVEIAGTRWLRLHFSGEHRGQTLNQQYYITALLGGSAIVGLASPASAFADLQAGFTESAATLRVHDCELAA